MSAHERFIKSIEQSCKNVGLYSKILPSILASQAILISQYGMETHSLLSRNLYHLTVDDKWEGMCYNKDDSKTYANKQLARDNSKVTAPILYRVYNDFYESIEDYANFLLCTRRSQNGPLKYNKNLTNIRDYKEFIDVLWRNGYAQDFLHIPDGDIVYKNDWIYLIEELKLNEWDMFVIEETDRMSNRARRKAMKSFSKSVDVSSIQEMENENKKTFTEDDPIYRVRKTWEDQPSQLIATQDIDIAMSEAMKHAGYKVYVGENGELFKDPWVKTQEPVEEAPKTLINEVNVIQARMPITLNKKIPVYNSYVSKKPHFYISGTLYFYDNVVKNNKVKITKTAYKDKTKNVVIGYVSIDDIF